MYEESLKMPLIVKWPGVTKPAAVNTERNGRLWGWQKYFNEDGVLLREDEHGERGVLLRRKRYSAQGVLEREERFLEDGSRI